MVSGKRNHGPSTRLSPLHLIFLFTLVFAVKAHPTESDPPPDKFIGIQIGAGNTRVGVIQNGTLEVFTNSQGSKHTPSHVVYTHEGFLVGEDARQHPGPNLFEAVMDLDHLFSNTSASEEAQKTSSDPPYTIIQHPRNPKVILNTNGISHSFTPEEIYAPILTEMRQIAESHIGDGITGAVVSIPAPYAEDPIREMIRRAGTLANLPIQREVREPAAVGLAYKLDDIYPSDDINVLAYDMGSRYLDITYMNMDYGVFDILETVRVRVGGEDFNRQVVEYLASQYQEKHNLDFRDDPQAVTRLMDEVEKGKLVLSSEPSYQIHLDDFYNGMEFSQEFTRELFEDVNGELFQSTTPYIDRILESGNLTQTGLDHVLLAGGSTQIPFLQEMVQNYFRWGQHFGEVEVSKIENPEEASVWGAAIQAKVLQMEDDWGGCCCGCWEEGNEMC